MYVCIDIVYIRVSILIDKLLMATLWVHKPCCLPPNEKSPPPKKSLYLDLSKYTLFPGHIFSREKARQQQQQDSKYMTR